MANGDNKLHFVTLPVTAIVAITLAGVGWWVNNLDGRLISAKQSVRELSHKVQMLENDVTNRLTRLETKQEIVAEEITRLERKQ